MNNKKTIVVLLLTLLIISAGIGWLAFREKESPEFARIKRLQEKLINDETLTESERAAGWAEVKQTWPLLSESEQEALKARHNRKEREQMDRFFELETKEERIAYLDNVIDALEEQAAEKKKTQQGKNRDNDDAKRKKPQSKQRDPEAIRAGLRKYLDSTSPDERVKRRIYWTAVKRRWAVRHRVNK